MSRITPHITYYVHVYHHKKAFSGGAATHAPPVCWVRVGACMQAPHAPRWLFESLHEHFCGGFRLCPCSWESRNSVTVINPEGCKTQERGLFMHKPTLDQNWDFLRIRVLFPKCDISLHFLHLPYPTDFLHAGNSNFCLVQIPWQLIMAVLRSLIPRPLPPFLHVTLKRQEWPGDEASAVFMYVVSVVYTIQSSWFCLWLFTS